MSLSDVFFYIKSLSGEFLEGLANVVIFLYPSGDNRWKCVYENLLLRSFSLFITDIVEKKGVFEAWFSMVSC